MEWNVDTHIRCAWSPTRPATRSRISAAALLVKVIAKIWLGSTPRAPIRYAILRVSTDVFPEPAPATINSGEPMCSTAWRCCGLSPSSSDSESKLGSKPPPKPPPKLAAPLGALLLPAPAKWPKPPRPGVAPPDSPWFEPAWLSPLRPSSALKDPNSIPVSFPMMATTVAEPPDWTVRILWHNKNYERKPCGHSRRTHR